MRRSIGEFSSWMGMAFCLALAILLTSLSASPAEANEGADTDAAIQRAGLMVDWFTHSGAGARGKLVDWQLDINENKATTFFTITAGRYREVFSENTINAFGKPYGIDGAVEFASIRKEILEAELKNDGVENVEVKISQYTLPQSTIYFVTSLGVVTAIDADTGMLKWSTLVGDGRLPSIGVAADNNHVAAVNGSSVYCLEAETGKILWSQKCRYAVSAPPSVSEERVYVPLVNGRLETFSIKDKGLSSTVFVAEGVGMARPLITDKTVVWPTNIGDLNVAPRYGSYHGVSYQLNADKSIVCSPTFKDDMLFVCSLDGFVYVLDEDRGRINWQVSTGAPISQSPIPLGEYVFVINDHYELFKFDIKSGDDAPGWERPRGNVARFVGASKDNLYVLDQFGKLKVLSQESGTTLSSVALSSVDLILPNLESDRLYVADRGMIRCIREVSRPIPFFHHNDEFGPAEVDATKAVMSEGNEAGDKPMTQGDLEDPFKVLDANSSNAQPADASADPFAGVDSNNEGNPFGGNKPAEPAKDAGAKPAAGNSGVEDDPFK